MGVQRTILIGAYTVMAYYYGTVLYDNLSIVRSKGPLVYGEVALTVHVKDFVRWGLRQKQKIGDDHSLGILPGPFCAMHMINDKLYAENEVGCPSKETIMENNHLLSLKYV